MDTLDLALQASGCDQVHVVHKPRLLSDNGSSYVSGDLAEWLKDRGHEALSQRAIVSSNLPIGHDQYSLNVDVALQTGKPFTVFPSEGL